MNEALFAASPLSAPRSEAATRLSQRGAWLLAAAACVLMLGSNLFWRESYTGDEGFYGVTAQNMLHSPDYIVRPSSYPLGEFAADKGGFGHPPLNSHFYALSLWLARGSLAGPHVLNVLCLAALLFFAYRLVSLFDRQAARFAVLLLAASPAILGSYSLLEAEPLMTTAGIAALYCALRGGFARGQRTWLLLSGLGIGFSFALKLWLCGPLALTVAVALIFRARQSGLGWRDKAAGSAVFALGAILPAGAHLLTTAYYYPQDVRFWLHNVYFGLFTQSGISGSKLAGDGVPVGWSHPFWYYAAAVYREHFFLFPIILLGAGSLLREARAKGQLLLILIVGMLGVVPLSVMKVKEPLYVLSCCIFIYLLAAWCLAAIARQLSSGGRLDSFSLKLGTFATAGLLLLVPLAYARGIKPDDLTGPFVLAHSLTFAVFLAAILWHNRKNPSPSFERTCHGIAAIALAAVFAFQGATRQTRDETIARVALPYIEGNPPGALSIVASNYKSYQYYSFRRGCYWHELPQHTTPEALFASARFKTVRVFILDPSDLQQPEIAPWLRWLETHAVEKTPELDLKLGAASGFRVFVRDVRKSERAS